MVKCESDLLSSEFNKLSQVKCYAQWIATFAGKITIIFSNIYSRSFI